MSRRCGLWRHEHGFTLAEVLITIIIMSILAAIAFTSWSRLIESRRVDSAANQLVADMRLAGTSATNRLQSYEVVLSAGSPNYQFGPQGSLQARTLPDGTRIAPSPATTVGGVRFLSNGTAERTSGTGNAINVGPTGVSCPSPRC